MSHHDPKARRLWCVGIGLRRTLDMVNANSSRSSGSSGHTWVSQAAAIVAFASLAVIVNWVAFGPGPRQFSGGLSVGSLVIWRGDWALSRSEDFDGHAAHFRPRQTECDGARAEVA